MYTALEKYLLSAPVRGLALPALIEPTEQDLMTREAELGWNRDEDKIGGLLATLRLNGVVVLFAPEVKHLERESL